MSATNLITSRGARGAGSKDQRYPDHCAIARFLSGAGTQKARELLALESGNSTKKKLESEIAKMDNVIAEQELCTKRGRGHHKPEAVRRRDALSKLNERWEDYEEKQAVFGDNRRSLSKTDPDAIFMHMKEDHMRNGQLKPGCNVRIAVNSGFVTGIGVFANRTDYGTLIPFLSAIEKKHGKKYARIVADSGYESLGQHRTIHG